MQVQLSLAEDATGEVDEQFAVARFPIFNPVAAHVCDGEILQRRKFDGIDACLFYVQSERVSDE